MYDEKRLQAVSIIESLRSGVPTRLSIREMPELRPELVDTIRGDLDCFSDGQVPPGRLIWGEYGQGKSHLLTCVEHLALEKNFAVSLASLSREVSCHDLLHFYRRLAPTIRTPNSNVPGLLGHLVRLKPSDLRGTPSEDPDRYCNRWLGAVLEVFLSCGADDEDYYSLYNHLMGYKMPVADVRRIAQSVGLEGLLRGLHPIKRQEAQAYFGVMADAVCLCGYKGWVILIDEVELVARLPKLSRLSAYRNLQWLLGWAGEMPYPIYVVGACARSLQDAWYGDNGRRVSDREAIPNLARERLGPEAAREMEEFFTRAVNDHNPSIGPVTRDAVVPLVERLVELHGIAHAWNPPISRSWVQDRLSELPEDTKLRVYIRYVLEMLDQLLIGGKPSVVISPLREPSVEEEEGFFLTDEDASEEGDVE
ncbi:MAG: BREX system ATP-binding domain-containing protein [Armatimonadota bacterium]